MLQIGSRFEGVVTQSMAEGSEIMAAKVRIAHVSGPTATIQNTPPLVTSDKARRKAGFAPRHDASDAPHRFDALRAQRLAAPVKVYAEQFSAHPLEIDAADLYAPPDGYVGPDGVFHRERQSDDDKPVLEIELRPEDGLYPLPYMALQQDGRPWDDDMPFPDAPASQTRQTFLPDGSRLIEEIDRFGLQSDGTAGAISSLATLDYFRPAPSGGFTRPPDSEQRGRDFFAYKPRHLAVAPPRPMLAQITNAMQAVAASGQYDGIIWTQGSPQIEEVTYWFNLLIDTRIPICGNAAHRAHGEISGDGPKNILDSVRFIASRKWADPSGANRCGTVVIQDQQIFGAREVAKVDARPGGFHAMGGHGGILGQITHLGACHLTYAPLHKHTATSDLRLALLPTSVMAVRRDGETLVESRVSIKDAEGRLLGSAIPSVTIIKDGGFSTLDFGDDPSHELDLSASIEQKLKAGRLSGFVLEGLAPYGNSPSGARQTLLTRAVYSGLPVCRVGRGAPEGFADPHPCMIAASNLTATKARLLLMACLMKFGSLPIARSVEAPTADEIAATAAALTRYQSIFDTH